jgi:hypothetical protein
MTGWEPIKNEIYRARGSKWEVENSLEYSSGRIGYAIGFLPIG